MPKPTIQPFVQLGELLSHLSRTEEWPGFSCGLNESEYRDAQDLLHRVHHYNGWFTYENCLQALGEWGKLLQNDPMQTWVDQYTFGESIKTVGIICAGNIPAVGFHDVVCVLASGHRALIKCSKDDNLLIPAFLAWLVKFDHTLADWYQLVERLEEFDAVIATGSNNSSRYFERYFGHVPHIIRKSRTSIAVLDDNESDEALAALAQDIFSYFGLGCRNVTKVYLPDDMDLDRLFNAFYAFRGLANHAKYANNYDYNKAVWLLNREDLLENGFILLKQDERLACPTASLFYERYSDLQALEHKLATLKESIQCRVGVHGLPLGSAQQPRWSDYADGVDTMAFLAQL